MTRVRYQLALGAMILALAGTAEATTITFTGHTANSDVTDKDNGGYGSHVADETQDFITSDGTGATPNIALIWETATGPNADVWEFHDSATFSLLDPATTGDPPRPTGVAQLDVNIQNGIPPADPTIMFVPDLGYAVTIHSFNIGHATDLKPHEGKNSWKITLLRMSDKKVVWSHTTQVLDAGDSEAVKVGFKGEPGENYRLRFDRGLVNHPRAGIDNLSFSQSERQPLTKEEVARAAETLRARIEKLEKELAKTNQMRERMAEGVAEATQVAEQASGDEAEIAEARNEAARERAGRLDEVAAQLARQLDAAKAEQARLLKEQEADVASKEETTKEDTDAEQDSDNGEGVASDDAGR